jgi:hypothetical protein
MTKTPSQILRETMDAINSISAPVAAKPAAPISRRSFKFTSWIANPKFSMDNEDEDEEIEVGVNYNISGRFRPSTMTDPADYPEMEITDIVDLSTGQDITNMITDKDMDRLQFEAWEHDKEERDAAEQDRADMDRDDHMRFESIDDDEELTESGEQTYECQVQLDIAYLPETDPRASGEGSEDTFWANVTFNIDAFPGEDLSPNDIKIRSVTDDETGVDIMAALSPSIIAMLRPACIKSIDDNNVQMKLDAAIDRYQDSQNRWH